MSLVNIQQYIHSTNNFKSQDFGKGSENKNYNI